ncbi:gamma-glutamyl-gamma-aminobutyrate hydrolase family protein [Fructobacillus ficulneus]|uniref:Peptidase C26 n=1 Tax=Fructobacillus ficulneus TaxID=157463 RepID=A0A0K8MGD7_9LACO|nr:gamma-glutamyl-gamma-aminobutyrate hydrolase family protein [Fructobacillus ficulneus]GAO99517.1 peptidase C26 [Fructobacillus ficulneus]
MRVGVTADVNLQSTDIINLQLASFAPKPLLDVIEKTGNVPVVFPITKPEYAAELVSMVGAVVIPGGPDVSPKLYGEGPHPKIGTTYPARDDFEVAVIKECVKQHKPLLGICRGTQLINVVFGGNMYQDLGSQYEQPLLQHSQAARGFLPTHDVEVTSGSFLSEAMGGGSTFFVNSRHHQALNKVAEGLNVVAQSADGVVEGFENDDHSIVGVQWHPENLWATMPEQEALFTNFFKKAKEVGQDEK